MHAKFRVEPRRRLRPMGALGRPAAGAPHDDIALLLAQWLAPPPGSDRSGTSRV